MGTAARPSPALFAAIAIVFACVLTGVNWGAQAAESAAASTASGQHGSVSSSQTSDSPSKPRDAKPAREPQTAEEEPIPAKVYRYAERLMQKYDRNGDGHLDAAEWQAISGDLRPVDVNRDQIITVDELVQYMVRYGQRRKIRLAHPAIGASSEAEPRESAAAEKEAAKDPGTAGTDPAEQPDKEQPADLAELESLRRSGKFYVSPKRLPAGLPAWFIARDADGDGQLTLQEFAAKPTAADLAKFAQYDLNGDGVITAEECVRATKQGKASGKKAAKP